MCVYLQAPQYAQPLLEKLVEQDTNGLFSFSLVVVVDNDRAESAREVVEAFASAAQFGVGYFVKPRHPSPARMCFSV